MSAPTHLPVAVAPPAAGGLVAVAALRPEPSVRGEAPLAALDGLLERLDALLHRFLPEAYNPLAHAGAAACVMLIVALVTGIPLLFWYVPTTRAAYASLETMPWAGAFLRSLHRYSSDACMLFSALHALRILAARRFGGARWLAWVTGLATVGLLWLVGWLGYWLVWDDRAGQLAVDTAKVLDRLPVFAEPFGRSFLTEASVKPLLFFIVLFLHMLIPLAMGIALWLHLARLQRARWLTGRWLTVGLLAALALGSLLVPATSGPAAHLSAPSGTLTLDLWYLLPIPLADRLSAGALWAILLGVTAALGPLPWWLGRGRPRPALINTSRCNSCEQCSRDCPYLAITMVPRTDGRAFPQEARVDPSKCVGCGVCVGSCDSGGTDLPLLPLDATRHRLDALLDAARARGERPSVAFLCAQSAGGGLAVDAASGRSPELPGYLVQPVPCAGWVHTLLVERALRHGARGVLIVGCAAEEPAYREGARFAALRLAGERKPALRDRVDASHVAFLELGRGARAKLVDQARAFHDGRPPPPERASPTRRVAAALVVSATLGALVLGPSAASCGGVPRAGPELVLSFKDTGDPGRCRTVSAEENARLPVHMRRPQICERGRAPVRLRVRIDGVTVVEKAYGARGLFGDGKSVAIEAFPVSAGDHDVEVALGDSWDPSAWTRQVSRRLSFPATERRVVLFDREAGFTFD